MRQYLPEIWDKITSDTPAPVGEKAPDPDATAGGTKSAVGPTESADRKPTEDEMGNVKMGSTRRGAITICICWIIELGTRMQNVWIGFLGTI